MDFSYALYIEERSSRFGLLDFGKIYLSQIKLDAWDRIWTEAQWFTQHLVLYL